ncbi:hypothetical protein AAC387_Pa11g0005 [Persea americana]
MAFSATTRPNFSFHLLPSPTQKPTSPSKPRTLLYLKNPFFLKPPRPHFISASVDVSKDDKPISEKPQSPPPPSEDDSFPSPSEKEPKLDQRWLEERFTILNIGISTNLKKNKIRSEGLGVSWIRLWGFKVGFMAESKLIAWGTPNPLVLMFVWSTLQLYSNLLETSASHVGTSMTRLPATPRTQFRRGCNSGSYRRTSGARRAGRRSSSS